nr:hypothetical protein [Tanacetum cinerariifolium]
MFVIEQPIPPAPAANSEANVLAEWNALYDIHNKVACLMLGSMTPELHRQFENYSPYEMLQKLSSMFEKQAGVERFDLIQTFHACKQEDGKSVAVYVLQMKGYVNQLERLGYKAKKKSLKAKGKGKANGKENDKQVYISKPKNPKPYTKEHPAKDDACHHRKEVSHWKRNYPVYLVELLNKNKQVGSVNYALESTTHILNMVPTKKVDKTPYELWYGKVPNLSYLKETMGYYFYFPPKNKIVVVRYAEFFEKNLITQEVNGRAIDLEEIQNEDTSPSKITSKIPMEVEGFEPPQEEVILIRRSRMEHRAPDRLCVNVEVEDHCLGDLNEPASYKAAMLDSESNKNKWIFKKKTNMDVIVHTYKAHLVAKGYTQLYGFDYKETFSPVADIRAIRILIFVAAFYDYEIWQMDVKTAFLNGYLDEDIYMVQPKGEAAFILGIKIYRYMSKRLIGLGQNAYVDKILKRYKMDNSKRGHIPMQEKLDLNRTQGASTPKEPFPGECHWTAMKHILKYLRNTKDMFLVYGGNSEVKIRVDYCCNVGFETDIDDMKSQIEYEFILNGRRSRLEKLQVKYYCKAYYIS